MNPSAHPGRLTRMALAGCMAVGALGGCASLGGANAPQPAALHRLTLPGAMELPSDAAARAMQEQIATDSYHASVAVAQAYFKALDEASKDPANTAKVATYTRQGVALVRLHCLRWFAAVEQAQQRGELDVTNHNVISSLGTTLLGLGHASQAVTASYGALNTAYTGFNANLSEAYLAAPSAANVKRLTLEALDSRAKQLLNEAPHQPTDFADAYLALERMANICTHAEVKRLTNKTVEQTGAEAGPKGDIEVFGTVTKQVAAQTDTLALLDDAAAALSDAQALAVVQLMPGRNEKTVRDRIAQRDPKRLRDHDPKAAREVIRFVLAMFGASKPEYLSAWRNLLQPAAGQ